MTDHLARGDAPALTARRGRVRRMRGSTLVGFVVGLILGLTIAVVVALFITQGNAPFANRAGRAPEKSFEPKTPAEAPDPNAPLHSRARTESEPPPAAEEKPAEESGGLLERLFGRRAEPETPRPADPSRPAQKSAETKAAGDARAEPRADSRGVDADRPSYLLQAGAFRGADEADAMRARLALIGFEARVVVGDANGQPIHRVRVGPFGSAEDMNKARTRLAENGIEASAVRQK